MGYECVTLLVRNKWAFLSRLFAGIPIGIIYQSFYAMFIQLHIDWGLLNAGVVIGTCFFIATLLHYFINCRFNPSLVIRMNVIDFISLAVGIFWMVYRLSLVYFDQGGLTRGAAYSDFNFHLTIITSFAFGCNQKRASFFDVQTVISSGSFLAYPMFVNFHAAFLIASCDASIPDSMKWSAFLMGISFVYLLHAISLEFTESSIAAALAIPLWFCSGGIGILEVFDNGMKEYTTYINYIHSWSNNVNAFWFQSMTHIFNPQRSATFAMPLCLITIYSLFWGVKSFGKGFFIIAALAVGVTPQTQIHAYVACAIFSISLALLTYPGKFLSRKYIESWLLFGILANAIAFPLSLPYFRRTMGNKSFFVWKPIWKMKTYSHSPFAFLRLWWKSLGPPGLVSVCLGFCFINYRQMIMYLSTIPVLLVSCSVMFQPWELDNTKLLHDIWFPVACGFVANYFVYAFAHGKIHIKLFIVILYLFSLISGFINLIATEPRPVNFFDGERKHQGHWVSENSGEYSLYQISNHVMLPSASFAGRLLFHGYPGWLSSHGLLNETRKGYVLMIEDGHNPGACRDNKIDFLVRMNQKTNEESDLDKLPWWELVFSEGEYKIWKFLPNWDEQSSQERRNANGKRTRTKRK